MSSRSSRPWVLGLGVFAAAITALSLLVPTSCWASTGGGDDVRLTARFQGPLVIQLLHDTGCRFDALSRLSAMLLAVAAASTISKVTSHRGDPVEGAVNLDQ